MDVKAWREDIEARGLKLATILLPAVIPFLLLRVDDARSGARGTHPKEPGEPGEAEKLERRAAEIRVKNGPKKQD